MPGPMAQIIAEVSLAFNHLWQDLGSGVARRITPADERLLSAAGGDERTQYALEKFFYRQRCLLQQGRSYLPFAKLRRVLGTQRLF